MSQVCVHGRSYGPTCFLRLCARGPVVTYVTRQRRGSRFLSYVLCMCTRVCGTVHESGCTCLARILVLLHLMTVVVRPAIPRWGRGRIFRGKVEE